MTGIVESDILERRAAMWTEDSRVAFAKNSAVAGNRAGFEQLAGIYQEKICRMVYYRTGSREAPHGQTQPLGA